MPFFDGAFGTGRSTDYDSFLKALTVELVWVKQPTLVHFLATQDSIRAPILAKAALLSLIGAEKTAEIAKNRGRTQLVKALVEAGQVEVAWFADLVRSETGFPLSRKKKGTFAEFLLSSNQVAYSDLLELLAEESNTHRRIETLLVERELMTAEEAWATLAKFLDLPFESEPKVAIAPEKVQGLPVRILERFRLTPLTERNRALVLGSDQPQTEAIIQRVTKTLNRKVEIRLCTPETFEASWSRFVELKEAENLTDETSETEIEPLTEEVPMKGFGRIRGSGIQLDSGSTVEMVAALIQQAVDNRATDIHIEPRRNEVNIRYRIDGFLYEVTQIEHQVGREIVSRIKILADMDITERRLPQDGHFRFAAGDAEYDMRLATVPTSFGERMEIRLAEGGKMVAGIEALGLEGKDVKTVEGFIRKPHGIVLATGPVGSGKTTTLYGCISKVDQRTLNVMTIEDPIEYVIPNANQIEVNYRLQFDFVHGLRAILRQDPDVILVGEIRDEETARIAIRAGMTGMLVFSTLHANDSVGSVTTLANFHINRFLIGSALVGSLAQRLVRKICPHCAEPVKPTKSIRLALGITAAQIKEYDLRQGKGCARCFYTGYQGRIGIFEVFSVSDKVRELIVSGAGEKQIRDAALDQGMTPLRDAALLKLKDGTTTVEEYVRVLG
jgi:type II secretory ATPase GspE/PulE/Tfp pilus assembly ATPase PilB-like protein